jgi:cold-inducible RNA-binding protein
MGKKMYVGNLSFETTEESLRALFAEFGQVESVNLITDRYSGRSRGFAFVEMDTEDAARAAISGLKSRMLDGRELDVAEARPQGDRKGGQRGGQRGGGRSRW